MQLHRQTFEIVNLIFFFLKTTECPGLMCSDVWLINVNRNCFKFGEPKLMCAWVELESRLTKMCLSTAVLLCVCLLDPAWAKFPAENVMTILNGLSISWRWPSYQHRGAKIQIPRSVPASWMQKTKSWASDTTGCQMGAVMTSCLGGGRLLSSYFTDGKSETQTS